MQTSTTVTGRLDAISTLELLHASNHFGLVRPAVVEAIDRRGLDVREKGRRGAGDRDRGGGIKKERGVVGGFGGYFCGF